MGWDGIEMRLDVEVWAEMIVNLGLGPPLRVCIRRGH